VRGIPILMYHEVASRPLPGYQKYTVSPAAFAAQMAWLAAARYTTVGFDDLLAHRLGRGRLPRRPVIVTFDDGYEDCAEHAVPPLRARGFVATFFLVAGLVGDTTRWLTPGRGFELPLMSWATARRLEASGFSCGSHSMTHPHLARITDEACSAELLDSRRLLEERLGHAVRHFAYPWGSVDQRVQAHASEAGYQSACSVRIGLATPGDNPLALPRVPVTGHDSLADFICRLRCGVTLREMLQGKRGGAWRRRCNGSAKTAS
jgi:peptidoglycan/xylan/chitin deacetylase (PgdA/CDA1 family)